MKKVYSASREDIEKRQQENENWYSEQNAKYLKQYNTYKDELTKAEKGLTNHIIHELSPYMELLNLDVSVNSPYNWSNSNFRVFICCNNGRYDENLALSWSYEVDLDKDGNVVSESNSWSGLKATTPELVKNLQLSVDCLKQIQDIDWKGLLDYYTRPSYSEYVTEEDPEYSYNRNKAALDNKMEEVEVDELIGTNKVILNKGKSKYWNGDTYVKIYRDTGAQYEIGEVSANYIDRYLEKGETTIENIIKELSYKHRVSKKKFLDGLARPFVIKDVDSLS
ncbi:MAG: hypothetical protein LUC17_01340 [Oscillospiraceae bacterium]|nr:hypothetical protein [Oscillospiraceae bacterium]